MNRRYFIDVVESGYYVWFRYRRAGKARALAFVSFNDVVWA